MRSNILRFLARIFYLDHAVNFEMSENDYKQMLVTLGKAKLKGGDTLSIQGKGPDILIIRIR